MLQRARIRQYLAKGLDASKALALLKVMEGALEQFHASRRVLDSCASRGMAQPWMGRSSAGHCRGEISGRAPQPARRREPAYLNCPHCELIIWVKRDGDLSFAYDVADWEQRCCHSEFRSPLLCQLLRGRHSPSLH